MSFNFGQRVRLTRDLQMSGFKITKNTAGTVTNLHLQTSVLFDGLEQELAVADNDIEAPGKKPKNATLQSNTGAAPMATAPVFQPGQRIRLLVTKNLGGQTILADSLGTITQDAPSMNAAWVIFDGFSGDKLIPKDDLVVA